MFDALDQDCAMKTRRKSRKKNASTHLGPALIESTQQAVAAIASGDYTGFKIHRVEIPDPCEYRPRDVRALRDAVGVTQRLFARLVGVSPELVEHWEQGVRKPSPLARRLMDKIKEDPAHYLSSLVKRTERASL
jgi:putative transcriptional regulator